MHARVSSPAANGNAVAGAGPGLWLGSGVAHLPVVIGRNGAVERRGQAYRCWAAAARVELTGREWWHGDM